MSHEIIDIGLHVPTTLSGKKYLSECTLFTFETLPAHMRPYLAHSRSLSRFHYRALSGSIRPYPAPTRRLSVPYPAPIRPYPVPHPSRIQPLLALLSTPGSQKCGNCGRLWRHCCDSTSITTDESQHFYTNLSTRIQ